MSKERWLSIPDFPDYAVSNLGRIKRIAASKTSKAGKVLNPCKMAAGYVGVVLRRDGESINQYVHSLVLSAFIGPRPTPQHQAAHFNGVRWDNRLANLRWALPAENCADKKAHGTDQVGMRHHRRKITDSDVLEIRRLRGLGVYCKDIAKRFGVHKAYVSLVASGKRWANI